MSSPHISSFCTLLNSSMCLNSNLTCGTVLSSHYIVSLVNRRDRQQDGKYTCRQTGEHTSLTSVARSNMIS